MDIAILVVHVLVALALVGLILLQQGKGADAGASFGAGGSQTVFGASGAGNFMTRLTSILAAVFFITSLLLAYAARQQADELREPTPMMETITEAAVDDVAPPAEAIVDIDDVEPPVEMDAMDESAPVEVVDPAQ